MNDIKQLNNSAPVAQMIDDMLEEESLVNDEKHTILLSGECTIYEVIEKQHLILEQWKDQPVVFDLKEVSDMDVCFLQLLMSCKKTARELQVSCEFIHIPDDVKAMMDSLYVTESLVN